MSNYSLENYSFKFLSSSIISSSKPFSCGTKQNDNDLNDFFTSDFLSYEENLFGKTYCFVDEVNNEIVCAFTVSNDSVKASFMDNSSKRRIRKKLSQSKATLKSYPAVLIGRLGVNLKYQQYKLGSQLLDFIKSWFIDGMNKTGCRFILVDAYNDEKPLNYYFKNDFAAIFKSEKEEKDYYKIKSEDSLRTRLLFFDLIKLKA